MSQNIIDGSQTPVEQPTSADLLGKMTEAICALNEAQEHLVDVAKDVAKHTTDPNAHGAATLANIAKAMSKPVLEDGMFTFKDAAGKPLMEPVNIKSEPGPKGDDGAKGDKGDMPDHRWNGTSLQLQKPDGSWGDEQNLQGPKGEDGINGAAGKAPEHEWNDTSLKFKNPDGSWGEEHNLKGEPGAKGDDGEKGDMPDHRWNGTSLQLQKPDGSWGDEHDLQGPKGQDGDAAIATADQPGIVQPDGRTVTVDVDGLLSALGGNLLLNSEEWLTESGTFEAQATGWHQILTVDGGNGGAYSTSQASLLGGTSGAYHFGSVWLEEGQAVDIVIGAGGLGGVGNTTTAGSGGVTRFGDFELSVILGNMRGQRSNAYAGGSLPANTHYVYATGGGPGSGAHGLFETGDTQAAANARSDASFWGGGGGATLAGDKSHYSVGAGKQGVICVRWHDPALATGPLPTPALFSARRMAAHAGGAPATVNLYDPETGQGSVWREEDTEAQLATGMITEEAWLEIRAQKAAEEYAAWLANPETKAERFAMLRAARDAKLNACDYLVAPDYPLSEEQRATVIVYRQALRDLPAQAGAPWDGGGEATPWPEEPAVSKVQAQPEETGQTEVPEV